MSRRRPKARVFPANSGSVLFLDWRVRSGGEPAAAQCPTSGKAGSPSGVRQSETPPASFAFGKRANGDFAGRALLHQYRRKAARPYLRICSSRLCLILPQNRSVRTTPNWPEMLWSAPPASRKTAGAGCHPDRIRRRNGNEYRTPANGKRAPLAARQLSRPRLAPLGGPDRSGLRTEAFQYRRPARARSCPSGRPDPD